MEEPETIVDGAMEQHYKMIRSFKGVPGVKPERFAEALDIQHCALSLVGYVGYSCAGDLGPR